MIPVYLMIENFMSHKYTEIDCTQFDSTLILAQEKSNPRESNGIGKSVIYHAIKYVLFGDYPTSVIEKIVRDGTDGCRVVFDFEHNSRIFRIERSRKKGKSDIKLFEKIDGVFEDKNKEQKTTTETHNEIIKLININSNAFSNSVLFSQNDLEGMVSSKSEERRIILTDALGIAYYKKLEKMVSDAIKEISKDIDIHSALAEALGDPQTDIKIAIAKLNISQKVITDKQIKKNLTKASLISKRSELSNLERLVTSEVSSVHEKLNDIKTNKTKCNYDIETVSNEIDINKAKISSLNKTLLDKQTELLSLKASCDDLRGKKFRPIAKIKKELDKAYENETNGRAYIGTLENKASELRKPIPDDSECPTCRQDITKEYRSQYQQASIDKAVELDTLIASSKKKLKSCILKKNNLDNEIVEINTTQAKIVSVEGALDNKNTDIQYDIEYLDKIIKLNEQKANDLILLKSKLQDIKNVEASLNETVRNLSTDDVSIKILSVKKQVEVLEAEISLFSTEIMDENQNVGIYTAQSSSRSKDLDKLNNENDIILKQKKNYRAHKKVQKAFGSNGIPTLIIHTILDDLQIEANNYLAKLKPGLECQFNENLDLTFKVHGKEKEYKQISGGQKMLFAFSLKIGLSIVIQKRLGIDIKFILLDEVDQSLDDASVDTYADVIRTLQTDFKVFVITHDNRLKDKFNNAIIVEGDHLNGATSTFVSW